MIISPVCLFLFGSFFNVIEQLAALLNTFLQNVCERKAWSEGLGYRLYTNSASQNSICLPAVSQFRSGERKNLVACSIDLSHQMTAVTHQAYASRLLKKLKVLLEI